MLHFDNHTCTHIHSHTKCSNTQTYKYTYIITQARTSLFLIIVCVPHLLLLQKRVESSESKHLWATCASKAINETLIAHPISSAKPSIFYVSDSQSDFEEILTHLSNVSNMSTLQALSTSPSDRGTCHGIQQAVLEAWTLASACPVLVCTDQSSFGSLISSLAQQSPWMLRNGRCEKTKSFLPCYMELAHIQYFSCIESPSLKIQHDECCVDSSCLVTCLHHHKAKHIYVQVINALLLPWLGALFISSVLYCHRSHRVQHRKLIRIE